MTDVHCQPLRITTAQHTYRAERLASLRRRMDPLADDVVATFGELPSGCWHHMLTTALEHGIDRVPDAPESLRRLFMQLDTPPLWVDWEELNRGGASTLRSGLFGIVVLLCYALPIAYASPEGNKPIVMSGRLVAHTQRRIAETGRFVLETCRADGLQRWSDGFKLTVRVRLMHAQVRRSLLRAGAWRTAEWGAPINQVDMAGTTLLLSVQVLDALRHLGVHFSSDEAHAVMQLWRYSGYLLGVDDELLCGSETEGRRLAQLACRSMRAPDEHSRALVEALFKTAFTPPAGQARWPLGLYEGVARGLLGDDLADRLAIRRPWYARPMLPAIRTVVQTLELARRASPGMNRLATRTGHRLWTNCVEQGLAAAATEARPAELKLPIQAHI